MSHVGPVLPLALLSLITQALSRQVSKQSVGKKYNYKLGFAKLTSVIFLVSF
jgi:hypothetical protein